MVNTFFQLSKADFRGEFEGVMCAREVDHDGEIINWPGTVAAVKEWSTGMSQATGGKNFGNIRDQHSNMVIGKLTAPPEVDEDNKRITVKGVVVDPVAKDKLESALYTGLSIGGAYDGPKRQLRDGSVEYTPKLAELSLCDKPCSPSALLTVTRSDGSVLQKCFKTGMVARPNANQRLAYDSATQALLAVGKEPEKGLAPPVPSNPPYSIKQAALNVNLRRALSGK